MPQVDILRRADAFVTHGGMNSISEGLYCEVPLVVVPQQIEQALNGRRVAEVGAGILLGDRPPYGSVEPLWTGCSVSRSTPLAPGGLGVLPQIRRLRRSCVVDRITSWLSGEEANPPAATPSPIPSCAAPRAFRSCVFR